MLAFEHIDMSLQVLNLEALNLQRIEGIYNICIYVIGIL